MRREYCEACHRREEKARISELKGLAAALLIAGALLKAAWPTIDPVLRCLNPSPARAAQPVQSTQYDPNTSPQNPYNSLYQNIPASYKGARK